MFIKSNQLLVSLIEFCVERNLRPHEDLRRSSSISWLSNNIPVAHLLRIQIICSLVIIVVGIPVIPRNVFVGVDGEIIHDLLRSL